MRCTNDMNKVILMGRLTKEPDVRSNDNGLMIARYSLAVDRRGKEKETDFINCIAFGKNAEFAEKYLTKGTKIAVIGRIQTGSYTAKDGRKVYTTDVIVDEHEFAERRAVTENAKTETQDNRPPADGFMDVPDGIDQELPFL